LRQQRVLQVQQAPPQPLVQRPPERLRVQRVQVQQERVQQERERRVQQHR
jgi:hypothetical protein